MVTGTTERYLSWFITKFLALLALKIPPCLHPKGVSSVNIDIKDYRENMCVVIIVSIIFLFAGGIIFAVKLNDRDLKIANDEQLRLN